MTGCPGVWIDEDGRPLAHPLATWSGRLYPAPDRADEPARRAEAGPCTAIDAYERDSESLGAEDGADVTEGGLALWISKEQRIEVREELIGTLKRIQELRP